MAPQDLPPVFATPSLRAQLHLIVDSYHRLTGRSLVPDSGDVAAALWTAPCVIAAHGPEADPLFFFGNRCALERFDVSPEVFVGMPSRFSAEPLLQEKRQALLERVTRDGFIDDYSGIRIASSGQRFRIERATVWNLIDDTGALHGQAATFAHWTVLP